MKLSGVSNDNMIVSNEILVDFNENPGISHGEFGFSNKNMESPMKNSGVYYENLGSPMKRSGSPMRRNLQ